MWLSIVTGPLAASTTRPNGELLNQKVSGQCYDYDKVRAYLGAGPHDVSWGIQSWSRYPTAAEWAAGDRTLICQGSSQTDTPIGPTINFPLAGVMRARQSAAFRLCRSGPATNVTCDRPHTSEATSPNVVMPAGPWPGQATAALMAVRACTPVMEEYLGQALSARPDLRIVPDGPDEQHWASGNRSAVCWVTRVDGGVSVGTVRGGLT